jgi:transposase InsO family protein
MVVGWQLAANMRKTLVLDALRMALARRALTLSWCITQTPARRAESSGRRNAGLLT